MLLLSFVLLISIFMFNFQTLAEEIRHYEQYGKVEWLQYDKEEGNLHCIAFESAAVAKKIKSDGYIYIHDERIEVEVDDDGMLQQSSSDRNSLHDDVFNIIGLHDDCLRFIFKKFHIATLLSLSKVCVRFNEMAKQVFKIKYRTTQILFCDVVRKYPIPLKLIEEFFTTFGDSIESLYITPAEFDFDKYHLNDVLMQINKNCNNLQHLDMETIEIKDKISNEIFPLFSRLEYLKIRFDYTQPDEIIQSFEDLIASCQKLKVLNIFRMANSTNEGIVQSSLLPLICLNILVIYTSNIEYLQLFLLNNLQLTEIGICLDACRQPEILIQVPNLFRLICEQFSHIESLSILIISSERFTTDLTQFSELKRLSHFKLNFILNPISSMTTMILDPIVLPLMTSMHENEIKLESLEFDCNFIRVGTINAISKMKSISSLKLMLHGNDFESHQKLFKLVKQLPKLNELCIKIWPYNSIEIIDFIKQIIINGQNLSQLELSMRTCQSNIICCKYDDLLKIVKQREIPKKLTIWITADYPSLHLNAQILCK